MVGLMGRLVADPELKHTTTDIAVCSFTIAVDRTFQAKGQEKKADFINIVTWRNTAEFVCKYFRKGQLLALQGSIQTRQYNDKDGNKRTAFEIVADNVFFAEAKRDGTSTGPRFDSQVPQFNEAPPAFSTASSGDFEEIVGDDELPF
jgi:single-strand DNA-binding protein